MQTLHVKWKQLMSVQFGVYSQSRLSSVRRNRRDKMSCFVDSGALLCLCVAVVVNTATIMTHSYELQRSDRAAVCVCVCVL